MNQSPIKVGRRRLGAGEHASFGYEFEGGREK